MSLSIPAPRQPHLSAQLCNTFEKNQGNPKQPLMLRRNKSEDSVNTFLASLSMVSENDCDLESNFSDETLDAAATPVFQNRISTYTKLRELPLVTGLLKPELLLYSSMRDLKSGQPPLFSAQSNKLHFMKKNAPILTVFQHEGGKRRDYCKIYFKILQNNLTCYVLMFTSGKNVILYNNALKPHCDTIYKNTKLRIYGASGASSTFGNGALKMFLLNHSSASLADGMSDEKVSAMTSIKDLEISDHQKSTKLYSALANHRRNEVSKLLSQAVDIAPVPFATFFDHGGEKVDGLKVEGSIRLFESSDRPDDHISEDVLVLSTIMLTLVEQELSKMRGHNKPSFVNHNSN